MLSVCLTSNLKVNALTVAGEAAVRKEQQARNAQIMSETVAGVEAVRNAIQVLQDFNNAGHTLLQGQQLTKYMAQHDRKRVVLDILEVTETDFARVLSETKQDGAQQSSQYARLMAKLKKAKGSMANDVRDSGLAKDQEEYIWDKAQANSAIQQVRFEHFLFFQKSATM